VPLTGRYAAQGAQVRAGLELWGGRAGVRVAIEDDGSDPERAVAVHAAFVRRGCRIVLGPYGGDCVRAVAGALGGSVVWNHGAAADDVQRLPGVVSVPTPASRYLVALGHAIADLRPGARVVVATAGGAFGRLARAGLERAAPGLGLRLVGACSLRESPQRIVAAGPDAVLAAGPLAAERALLAALRDRRPSLLLGGVSPGLRHVAGRSAAEVDGMLAVVQWHPDLDDAPALGPSSSALVTDARRAGLPELDYVAAQAYAAALVAGHCLEIDRDEPERAARSLRTTTFFGAFALDPATGAQAAHRLSVVRWRHGEQRLFASDVG
jgi:ABC-type branched-subunit amino acid transport system substrate-binding protein